MVSPTFRKSKVESAALKLQACAPLPLPVLSTLVPNAKAVVSAVC